jgi:hypothetical protein
MMKKRKSKIVSSLVILILFFSLTIFSSIQIKAGYPRKRMNHCMVYDSSNDRIIMYGGQTEIGDGYYTFDTWSYDYNTNLWTKMDTENTPYGAYTAMAYDSVSKEIISYGGIRGKNVVSNQTWVYDCQENTWTKIIPKVSPGKRYGHRMVYDKESDFLVLFGGILNKEANPAGITLRYNDTWLYDINSNVWTNVTTKNHPRVHGGYTFAYDTESDRVILFGGTSAEDLDTDSDSIWPSSDVWAYDCNSNQWENVTTPNGPWGRLGEWSEYDSTHDLCIMFGGSSNYGGSISSETWSYDYNSNLWTELGSGVWSEVGSELNLSRQNHAMGYDSESDRTILFGGRSSESPLNVLDETWIFDYNDNTWVRMKTEEISFSLISSIVSLNLIVVALLLVRRYKRK